MIELSTLALASAVLIAGYVSLRCATSPNASPRQGWKKDRISVLIKPQNMVASRIVCTMLYLYHAVLILSSSDPAPVCHGTAYLNHSLFTWNWHTSTCLFLIICIGGPIRIAAFARLGRLFTFRLAAPDKLITTGLYHYVQHPGYTGILLVTLANLGLFLRWDASPACLVPGFMLAKVYGYGYIFTGALITLMLWLGMKRMNDEEMMMKETFGIEWEKWHRSTRRLIPGIY